MKSTFHVLPLFLLVFASHIAVTGEKSAFGGIVLSNSGVSRKATARIERAREHVRQSSLEDAKRVLSSLNELPNTLASEIVLFELLIEEGQAAEAKRQLELFSIQTKPRFDVFYAFSRLAIVEKRWFDAFVHAQLAVHQPMPENWDSDFQDRMKMEATLVMMQSSEARGSWSQVQSALATLEVDSESDPRIIIYAAKSSLLTDDADSALTHFRALAKHESDPTSPHLLAARVLASQRQIKKADKHYRLAIESANKLESTQARLEMAAWLVDQQSSREAQQLLKGQQFEGEFAEQANLVQALIHRMRREFDEAEILLRNLLASSQDKFTVNNQLALVLSSKENEKDAKEAFQIAQRNLEAFPNHPEALATMGWTQLLTGDVDAAEQSLSSSSQGGVISRDTAFFLSRMLSIRGKSEESMKLLDAAKNGQGPFFYDYLAK